MSGSGALFLPLWTDAYLGDTAHLTTVQHGAYLLLLMVMWRSGGSLPNNERRLARTVKLPLDKWRLVNPEILELLEFEGDKVSQKRLRLELEKTRGLVAKRAAAGRAGFQAKQLKKMEDARAIAETEYGPEQQHSGSLQSPVSNLQSLDKEREVGDGQVGSEHGGQLSQHGVSSVRANAQIGYALEDGVIKLTQAQLDKYVAAFPHVNVRGVLLASSEWIAKEAERPGKSWIGVATGLLGKRERENEAAAAERMVRAQVAAAASTKPRQSRI